jgi:putative ABC transport system permease protein
MRMLVDDVRHALRALLKRPRLAAAIAVPLALGIGANSAIFGIVDAALFRPLPVSEPERLVKIYATDKNDPSVLNPSPYPVYKDYRDGIPAFSALAAYSDPMAAHVSAEDSVAERVPCMVVSGNYFETLGVRAARGRALEPADDAPGAARVVVLSDDYWRSHFAEDPAAVGATLRLDGHEFTVVGVAPAEFTGIDLDSFGGVPDLWVTASNVDVVMSEEAELNPLTGRGFSWLYVVGRLAPGATLSEAQAQLDVLAEDRAERQAAERRQDPFARAVPAAEAALDPESAGATVRMAWILVGIVACVLLIACVDAAGLLLARGEERQRELAIRVALGASRGRVVRLLLIESLLIAASAAVLGLVVAAWVTDIFVALAPPGFALSPDTLSPVGGWRVVAFTGGAAVLVALLFGVLPALRASKVDLVPALKSEARFVPHVGGRVPLRSAFLVLQVGLSVVLLAGAGLLLRTLWNAYQVDPGFDPSKLAVASVDLGPQGYGRDQGREAIARILENVRALPGVRSAALARSVPVQRGGMQTSLQFEGVEENPDDWADLNSVGPGFFSTLGVPLLRGRDFTDADTKDTPEVVVVNKAFAERYWPGQDPIGKRIMNYGTKGAEVVGLVADFKTRTLRAPAPPTVFASYAQFYMPRMTIVVRTVSDPAPVLASIQTAVSRVDPRLPAFDRRTGEEKLGVVLAQERIVAWLLVTFAGLAALLTATGFYGAFAYQTRLRTREFAIRMALGARRLDLVRGVLGRGVALAAVGVALGLAAAFALSGVLASLLFDVAPSDPASFAAAALLFIALPALASYLPARRASRIDPAEALRDE